MNKENGKKMAKLVFFVALTVFGIYMTFFLDTTQENRGDADDTELLGKMNTENTEEPENIFTEAQNVNSLPDVENESDAESYTEGIEPEIYFANTDVIDKGNLPLEVHAVLVNLTQKYLNRSGHEDVSELYIDEESYTENEEYIAFNCFMDGYTEQLRIEFEMAEEKLKFSLVN